MEKMSSKRDEMMRYLALYKEIQEARSVIKYHEQLITAYEDEQSKLHDVLHKSVQPRCGSATQPSRRIVTDGQYTTLIVEWDDKSSSPAIRVQEPEK